MCVLQPPGKKHPPNHENQEHHKGNEAELSMHEPLAKSNGKKELMETYTIKYEKVNHI